MFLFLCCHFVPCILATTHWVLPQEGWNLPVFICRCSNCPFVNDSNLGYFASSSWMWHPRFMGGSAVLAVMLLWSFKIFMYCGYVYIVVTNHSSQWLALICADLLLWQSDVFCKYLQNAANLYRFGKLWYQTILQWPTCAMLGVYKYGLFLIGSLIIQILIDIVHCLGLNWYICNGRSRWSRLGLSDGPYLRIIFPLHLKMQKEPLNIPLHSTVCNIICI